ncbi:MAG: hypothetical protein ACREMA_00075, partial [Longimicrobiales bacterium]
IGWFDEQRASLAGAVGRLIELGEVRVLVRVGAVILEFAGTPQRFFQDDWVFAAPVGGARVAPANGQRHDSGDYRVGTVVRLTPAEASWLTVLRFGARLPTTDNLVGLDRDQTDFYALVGTEHIKRRWRFAAELGLGIFGTRLSNFEQSDVLLYSGTLQYADNRLMPFVTVVGQDDFNDRHIRGNEDLSEMRAGLRLGKARWMEAAFVYGLREYSPGAGFWLGGGLTLDWR